MNCQRCGCGDFRRDGGYLICRACGAQTWAGLPEKHTEKHRELPTEEDMISCPRGT